MKMSDVQVGQKVKIQLRKPRTWALWAREAFPGRTGVVEELKKERCLVRFDSPVPADRPGRRETTCFHFEPADLVAQ